MDASKFMVIAKGRICTDEIISCERNRATGKYEVTFNNGKQYAYAINNVIFMDSPTVLNPRDYNIVTPDGKSLYDIRSIYQFVNKTDKYWHIVLKDFSLDYRKDDLKISESCLTDKSSANTFDYLKEVSGLSNLRTDKGELILKKHYEKLTFVPDDTALSLFLDNTKRMARHKVDNVIFPFGCNTSQYKAVKNALENQLSVIQGPPGTGKTQTILNIIANLIINKKTVMVVSNNNSATLNVLEKLSEEKYGLDFMVAPLGNADNKEFFVDGQTGKYPDLTGWYLEDDEELTNDIRKISERLQSSYLLKEEIAQLKEKKYAIEIEARHFEKYANETAVDHKAIRVRRGISSERIMRLWNELQTRADRIKKLSVLFKLRSILLYGIADWKFYKQDLSAIIAVLQGMYYEQSLKEIERELDEKERRLETEKGDFEEQLTDKSLRYLRHIIVQKYDWKADRSIFTGKDLYFESAKVLKEYPIVLSTTFSSRTSLNMDNVQYDYVIMDEASQVDIATGALALSCAKNAVIVGDLKQLPNVVTNETYAIAEQIRKRYSIGEAYDFGNKSFLQSIIDAIDNVPSTLLREHYRCHPRIISFCNQKFYNNELLVMTEDDNLGKALMAVKTVEGNHSRGNYNQRQIDVIKEEILPTIDIPKEKVGIIAPYNAQVDAIMDQIPGIDVATVHKFQGREKDIIILSTVDDQIKDFTDDPYLLNVAVSRAKKRLIVVVSGNEQDKTGNIVDLVSYIRYNRMEVVDSQVYSVFDYLYSQYREKRRAFLRGKARISEYDSENLTYTVLCDILKDHSEYGVVCHEPLAMIIRDVSKLSDDEMKYALNPATHVDFLIFNKLSKQPVAAIETDGYMYHKEGTTQYERDKKKDHILELCGLTLIRLSTNGSGEKERILGVLGLE